MTLVQGEEKFPKLTCEPTTKATPKEQKGPDEEL